MAENSHPENTPRPSSDCLNPPDFTAGPAGRRLYTAFLWALSICLALMLNLTLFGLMPQLIGKVSQREETLSPVWPVTIARHRPQKPLKPKTQKPPAPREKKAPAVKTITPQPAPEKQKIDLRQVALDFRPELPPLETRLPVLSMQTVPVKPLLTAPPSAPQTARAFYGMDEIDAPLMAVSRVPPVYPLRARRKGIEGWVKVKFLVTPSGSVERVSIVKAQPADLFEQNVLRAVSSWRFKPGTVNGKPVSTWAITTLEFKLN